MTNDDAPRFEERITVEQGGERVEYVLASTVPTRRRYAIGTACLTFAGLNFVAAVFGTPAGLAVAAVLFLATALALAFGD